MSVPAKKWLRWFVSAAADLDDIVEHIAKDKPQAALRFAYKIKRRVELLRLFPYAGARCAEHPRVRYLVHGKYMIYYTVHRTEIVVRAVLHGSRASQFHWLRRRL
jgi:toxin ParE1/3/4